MRSRSVVFGFAMVSLTCGLSLGDGWARGGLGAGAAFGQAGSCVGDCNNGDEVTIDDIIVGVSIAQGTTLLTACPVLDANADGAVTIEEIIIAVNIALTACPQPVTDLSAKRVSTPPSGIDDPLWSTLPALTPQLANMSVNLLYGDGQLNMSGTFGGLAMFNGGQPADLKLRAAHDGTNLYILAEWNDRVFNLDRRRWLFDGPTDPLKPTESAAGWTSQLNDDKIALAFEIEPASSEFGTFASVGCGASCHNVVGEGLDMRPQSGKVDIWHWKTSRSEPLGYVDDQVSTPDPGRVDDAGTAIEHRNRPSGGNNRSGPATEWDGTPQMFERWDGEIITLDPAYIILDGFRMPFASDVAAGQTLYASSCAGCHGATGGGGIGPALTNVQYTRRSRAELTADMGAASHPGASSFNALSDPQKTDLLAELRGLSGVPGYYLTAPAGSVGDVLTQSNVDYTHVANTPRTTYRLLMIRPLNTGHDDDAQFTPGNEYAFGVALMDNDGRNHIGSRKETLSLEP